MLKLRSDPALVGRVEIKDGPQNFSHLLRWNVGAARDYFPFTIEESGSRPSAEIIAAINIGTLVGINADGDEALVDCANDNRIRVGCLVHHMAPVAPGAGDVEKNWFPR